MIPLRTAVLVDGAFFLKRWKRVFPHLDHQDPQIAADTLHGMATSHAHKETPPANLVRMLVYDCPPLQKRISYPVSKKPYNLEKTKSAIFRNEFHEALKKKRKTSLRLGRVDDQNYSWRLKLDAQEDLIKNKRHWRTIKDDDFEFTAKQTGVDMRLGIDIVLMSENKSVDQIVLIAGDSDFVPAAKHARRNGIDFILDPMWNHINDDLNEHIDGLRSAATNPSLRKAKLSSETVSDNSAESPARNDTDSLISNEGT